MIPAFDLNVLHSLLEGGVDMRVQDPKLLEGGTGRKYWWIRVFVPVVQPDGSIVRERRSVRLGWCDEMTKSDAKRAKASQLCAVNAGPIVIQSQVPFSALVEKYKAARLPQMGAATQAKYTCHLKNHILPAFGKMRLMDIDRQTVEAWLASKSEYGLATRLDMRSILSALFTAAEEWRLWSGDNPVHRVKVGRGGPVREKRYVTPEQMTRFLNCLPETCILPAPRARLLARLALVSGLRVSECLGLQAEDIDPSAETVTVRRRAHRGSVAEPKSRDSRRTVTVGSIAGELLRGGEPKSVWIFSRGGETLDDRDLQQYVWRPAATTANVYHEGFGLHTLRRMSITWAQEMGASTIEAQKRAGHSKASMTALYTVMGSEREREIAEGLGRRVN
jgi:integrase